MRVERMLTKVLMLCIMYSTMTVTVGFLMPQPLSRSIIHNNNYDKTSQSTSLLPVTSQPGTTNTQLNMMDMTMVSETLNSLSAMDSSNILLSFSDQGQNLAGIFFQLSLVPYLLFLYFLSFRANRINPLANFGFQYVLIFVLSTIPAGIISKSVYGFSLANTDWLHGAAEALLTTANILIVLGFKEAMTKQTQRQSITNKGRLIGLGIAGIVGLSLVVGPSFLEGHSAFLAGLGNLPTDIVQQNLPWVIHTEPENALSIPTWAIHFSSVFEYLFAMNLVWRYSEATQNDAWKGLTWGMLPLHASGICACTYHFFYNPAALQFLVTSQAGLTLLGNITCMIAAYRIAVSNGWNIFDEVPLLPKSATSPSGLLADGLAAVPLQTAPDAVESTKILAAKVIGLTIVTSYVVKYGELGLDLPFTPNAPVAIAMVLGFPGLVALQYYLKSQPTAEGGPFANFKLPSFGGSDSEDGRQPALSMADVKKYGVAGTVAYVLTELAFWVVAFPVAATALYQSTGHWPDIINDNTDRAAVLAFIFAGANIARAFVPIRLGAALALAPWVDENIINRNNNNNNDEGIVETTSTDA